MVGRRHTYDVYEYEERDRSKLLRRADTLASWALDAGIALVVLLPTLAVFSHDRKPTTHGAVAELVSAALLSVAPLLVRRRWPVQVLAVILVVGVAIPGPAIFSPPALIAVYTIASRRDRRTALASASLAVVAFAVHRLVWGYNLPLFGVISEIALSALALALGLYQATRLAYFEQLHDRAARLERERDLLIDQAAAEERLRIARELHDVVGHNVSLMVIQAQALEATASDEAAARSSARTIAELGRGAMSEMHRTLELMRGGPDGDLSPQPRLADLGQLLAQAQAAGVSAELSVDGEPRPLPTSLELSAYRIVQEALTNVIKHSGARHAFVKVRYSDVGLGLEIVDDGRGSDESETSQPGHGLLGMRERVALFGGSLRAGAIDGRGYRVEALLPYDEVR